MKKRNTRQKNLILEVMKNNDGTHLTIYEIFRLIQDIDPTIGQATVYRNVKKFVEEGKLYLVKTRMGIDYYDYCNNHIHFECLKCNRIFNVEDNELFLELKGRFKDHKDMIIDYKVTLEGYCEKCSAKHNKVIL